MKTFFIIAMLLITINAGANTIFFNENFNDNQFRDRNWYDGQGAISTVEHITGSTSSYECHFTVGSTNCQGVPPSTALRHYLSNDNSVHNSDSIYFSYWVKHSSNWQGSGLTKTYHPHLFYVMTTKDTDWVGFAYTYTTMYAEENLGFPDMGIQDGKNIDLANIGTDLCPNPVSNCTHTRAVAGCNGTQSGIGNLNTICYVLNGSQDNGMSWRSNGSAVFFDATEKVKWHFIEVYFKMNTFNGALENTDGIVQMWYDGTLIINHTNVILRTSANPTMQYHQIAFSPYIGDGSPVDQYIWFDDLTVADSPPSSIPAMLNPPSNLRIQ